MNQNTITVLLNGHQMELHTPAQLINHRVLVPAQDFYEAISPNGAIIEWRADERIMVAIFDKTIISAKSDNELIAINGNLVKADVSPRLIDGTFFVPVRLIAERLNASVEWEQKTKTVKIVMEEVERMKLIPDEFGEKDIEDIWKIEEKENFIAEMWMYISKKCEYGKKMENLNEQQRVFYIVQALEGEVNNGGFSQFFFNSDGIFANELVVAFERIGAVKTVKICKQALSVFEDEIPTEREKMQEFLCHEDETKEERMEEILSECDDAFYNYEDDLTELNYQFIIDNKESFLE